MSEKEKPLPKPPTSPFGRKGMVEEDTEKAGLMADQLAMAAAGGRLGEFMDKEIPDSEEARKLVSLMMGMTGMMPPEGVQASRPGDKSGQEAEEPLPDVKGLAAVPPEDLVKAAESGDVKEIMGILAREHQKRTGEAMPQEKSSIAGPGLPAVEKDVIDSLMSIASENSLSPDWIILRALKLYIREYQKTGSL